MLQSVLQRAESIQEKFRASLSDGHEFLGKQTNTFKRFQISARKQTHTNAHFHIIKNGNSRCLPLSLIETNELGVCAHENEIWSNIFVSSTGTNCCRHIRYFPLHFHLQKNKK